MISDSGVFEGSDQESKPVKILYQDSSLIAVRKAPGIHVHPTLLSPREVSLLQLLRRQLGLTLLPLHRLDRATSGIVLFALNTETASRLGADFRESKVQKTYRALVRGWIREEREIDFPLRDVEAASDAQTGPSDAEKPSFTRVKPLWHYEIPKPLGTHKTVRFTWVELNPETGRRHQLRRHLAKIAHPIIGDTSYGDRHHKHFCEKEFGLCFLQLFAVGLRFTHPYPELGSAQKALDNATVTITDSPETEFSGLLDQLRQFRLLPS